MSLLGILAVFTVVGLLNADMESLRPIAPPGTTTSQVLPVTGIIFVSYLGFVQITSVAEEIKDPGRNLPLAVLGSVVIVTVVYALFLVVLLAAVPTELVANNETAVVDAARLLFGNYSVFGYSLGAVGAGMLLIGGLLATASSANASILSSSRINFAMGREKSSPRNSTRSTTGSAPLQVDRAHRRAHPRVPRRRRRRESLSTMGSVHLIVYGLLNIALIVMRESEVEGTTPTSRSPSTRSCR